ncbi:recombinase family protein [Endozoicomonas sp. GU-1]|uniref:recombinase family protein n=1 Tax=Endozoicomonas sp. GU-1 TaxID=3009078 RepID=UPI0022B57E42|nr:recombinase family protein [Endozoicomonas sp. GU-1]WBA81970.1 recombinase family protein [Endozoicomonas sp. GU-1]WBA84920.1 recombinase family protein [Endozoicomonas sp. GU-1]
MVVQYVVYRRVSTRKQGDSGLGLEAQDRDISLYLQNYEPGDYELLGSFVDVESGTHDDRPELGKAMDMARKTGATLLVSKLDRLSRKVSFIASLLDDKRLSLKVACMPNADKFQLHIYAALAEQERDFISARTKAALKEAKARGTQLGGLRDATHKRNQAARQQAQYRADRLKALVLPMVEQGKTTRLIADALNRAGILTSRGNRWQSGQVSRLIGRLREK